MGRRLIVDTNVLIAIERGKDNDLDLNDTDEIAIAAVTEAELLLGIELADDPAVAAKRRRSVHAILDSVDTLDYTPKTAAHHAALLAHVRRTGTPRGAHDIIIAAHAAETQRLILSRDAKARFADLPGVLSA